MIKTTKWTGKIFFKSPKIPPNNFFVHSNNPYDKKKCQLNENTDVQMIILSNIGDHIEIAKSVQIKTIRSFYLSFSPFTSQTQDTRVALMFSSNSQQVREYLPKYRPVPVTDC